MAIRILIIALCAYVVAANAQNLEQSEFVVDTGDSIIISVYNEPDLYVRTRVDDTGTVKFPLIGSVEVSGKTPSILEATIEAALFDGYLVTPDVTVTVEKYRPVYIKGAVKLPGAYDFRLNLTVEQAIAIGGGLRDRASKSAWYILRGKTKEKIKVAQEFRLHPGDTLHIEESIF